MNELQMGYRVMWQTVISLGGISSIGISMYYLYRMMFPEDKPDKQLEKLTDFFRNTKLYSKDKEGNPNMPHLINHDTHEHGKIFVYTIPNGKAISEYKRKEEALSHVLKADVEIWNQHNRMFIKTIEPLPELIEFNVKELLSKLANMKIAFPVGYTLDKLILHDLTSSGKHILLSGTTRYGKSNLLNVIITIMLLAYTKAIVQFNLIDLKHGVEFTDYEDFPQVLNVVDTLEDTQLILQELIKEHKSRMDIVKRAGQKNIEGLGLPHIITVIDEYAAISGDEDIKSMMELLLQQGGASGLYFIIATQYPRNDVVDKLITVNCDVRISLRMKEPSASRVVLGNELAYHLNPIPGRAIYQYEDDIEVQIPYLDEKVQKQLLADRLEELAHKKESEPAKEFGGMIL